MQEIHFRYTDTSNIRSFHDFSIVEGNIKHIKDRLKYVEVQNINPASINSFKNSIASFDLLSQLDLNDRANPNVNYNVFSSVLEQAKNRHLPQEKFNVLIVVGTALSHG